MSPDFTLLLVVGILSSIPILGFTWWRFGIADMLVFIIVVGLFSAVMDFISSFVRELSFHCRRHGGRQERRHAE